MSHPVMRPRPPSPQAQAPSPSKSSFLPLSLSLSARPYRESAQYMNSKHIKLAGSTDYTDPRRKANTQTETDWHFTTKKKDSFTTRDTLARSPEL
ncbi:hypothetical protein BCV70DRAFT_201027 [Testicularia cyperi]|uniref:Uncharacterized protein n=1 Tax=Testicularia cyperi TaxID=1882483 RepID=A0A317XN08_9BASI|nr:hypothetical protein BCV70DRAFT_201027 [Testicularia cyperi]